jgi:hypothetical protein
MDEERSLQRLERSLNALNDLDIAWWPFVHLRPAEEERMGSRRVALLALLYGLFAGLLVNVVAAVAGQADHLPPALFPLGATLAFFLVFRFTLAFSWNRRAARLRSAIRAAKTSRSAEPTDG